MCTRKTFPSSRRSCRNRHCRSWSRYCCRCCCRSCSGSFSPQPCRRCSGPRSGKRRGTETPWFPSDVCVIVSGLLVVGVKKGREVAVECCRGSTVRGKRNKKVDLTEVRPEGGKLCVFFFGPGSSWSCRQLGGEDSVMCGDASRVVSSSCLCCLIWLPKSCWKR